MTREVLIAIKNRQTMPGGIQDTVDAVFPGEYFFRNGKHYLKYENLEEGMEVPDRVMVKAYEGYMENTRKGCINTSLCCETGKENTCEYTTPYGKLDLEIKGKYVRIQENEDRIIIRAEYSMDMNMERMAECDMTIQVTPRHLGVKLGK